MTRVLAVLSVLVLGGMLSGCGPGTADLPPSASPETDPSVTPSATPEPEPTVPASQFAPVEPDAYLSNYGDGVEFDSPSLNIQCGIFPDPDLRFFACSIDEYDYVDPPPPPEQLACSQNISYGHGFMAPLDGPVVVLCRGGAGEWEVDPHPVLPYDSSITYGGVVCESTSDHMGCRSLDTGHGFTLSRNSYTMF